MIDYNIIADAQNYYQSKRYAYIDVPWAVDHEISAITLPSDRVDIAHLRQRVGLGPLKIKALVASGEQSFLQMLKNKSFTENSYNSMFPNNSYKFMCVTPCFRDEKKLDELHQLYFMKLELIDLYIVDMTNLHKMIMDAKEFFDKYLATKVIQLNNNEFDIVSNSGIELGSYGIRTHDEIGSWIYGTGVAEPRLNKTIDIEQRFVSSLYHTQTDVGPDSFGGSDEESHYMAQTSAKKLIDEINEFNEKNNDDKNSRTN